jgi:hypothetical protein
MIAVERQIQKVRPGKWAALEEIEEKFAAVESRYGFPPKKRYQCVFGGHDTNTLIIERQWDSFAAMEAAYEKMFQDAGHKALITEVVEIIESQQIEVYTPLP